MNVRTYVRVPYRPGAYLSSLDAARRLAVAAARTLLNLPYYLAAMTVETRPDSVVYQRHVGRTCGLPPIYARLIEAFERSPSSAALPLVECGVHTPFEIQRS